MTQLVLILDNIRSAANVGSILRTADALGIQRAICVGITPYPRLPRDPRDPVVIASNHRTIAKAALGAEQTVHCEHFDNPAAAIAVCVAEGRTIYGLEIAPKAQSIFDFKATLPAALIVGNEVNGLSPATLSACDEILSIPQRGRKESLNVAVATGIAAYQLLIKTF